MDEDLKSYLGEKEVGTASLAAGEMRAMEARTASQMRESEERMALLIASEVGGLRSHIQKFEQQLTSRFDLIDAGLKLQADQIQSAVRLMTRVADSSGDFEER